MKREQREETLVEARRRVFRETAILFPIVIGFVPVLIIVTVLVLGAYELFVYYGG